MTDAGTLQVTPDALDDQIKKDAEGFGSAVASGSWVAAILLGVGLATTLAKKFIPLKKVEPPKEVKADEDADKAADKARAQLSMGKKPEDQ